MLHKHAVNALVTSAPSSLPSVRASLCTRKARGGPWHGGAEQGSHQEEPDLKNPGAVQVWAEFEPDQHCRTGAVVAGGRRVLPGVRGSRAGALRGRAEYASHPLFRRLLDDAEREYGHAARARLRCRATSTRSSTSCGTWSMAMAVETKMRSARPCRRRQSAACGASGRTAPQDTG